jgi:uncharacterized membrane protein YgdD (TMEM256/DUF423 family)
LENTMNPSTVLVCGAVLGALAVAAGAFGAHGLEGRLEADQLVTFDKAVRYQMYHALALVLVGLLALHRPSPATTVAAVAFLVGIVLFSGGLYGWVLAGIGPLVHVVPVGGTAFIVGWVALAAAAWKVKA